MYRYPAFMPSAITRRIERDLQLPGMANALSTRLSPSDLRSLLLDVFEVRAEAVTPSAVVAQSHRDNLTAPSSVSARDFLAFDRAAFDAAAEFDALDLSPVCPFGAASVLGAQSQNNVLTSIRNVEVSGDPTLALAIEASHRRRSGIVRLAASHRVVRLQPFDAPGFTPHFRLFALATAGRDLGSCRFETPHLREHARAYLNCFRLLNANGFAFQSPSVEFSDMTAVDAALVAAGVTRDEVRESIRAHRPGGSEQFLGERGVTLPPGPRDGLLEAEVLTPLRAEFPEAQFSLNPRRLEGLGYYSSFALRISPLAPDGNRYPIVDGGFTDWTARLLGNRKERLLISGVGSEFACKTFTTAPPTSTTKPPRPATPPD